MRAVGGLGRRTQSRAPLTVRKVEVERQLQCLGELGTDLKENVAVRPPVCCPSAGQPGGISQAGLGWPQQQTTPNLTGVTQERCMLLIPTWCRSGTAVPPGHQAEKR